MIKILFLAANPSSTSQLQLDEESRAIDQALRMAEFRDSFDLNSHWAVHYSDLPELLMRYAPDIVHFSGHGSPTGEVILDNGNGEGHPISAEALGRLFAVLKDNVRCVVLNACFSQIHAEAIAEHIDCVIGMSNAISDTASIDFAAAFYQGLGYGRNIQEAFDLACNRIDLANSAEQDTPKLLARRTDPKQITLVNTVDSEDAQRPTSANRTAQISTGGGLFIDGNVTTSHGDFVGRDKIVHIHTTQPPRIPLERPPRVENFQDRKAELSNLLKELLPGQIVTLCGPGGIGKSALASEAIWQLTPNDRPPQQFPDGVLLHDFRKESKAELALEHIAHSFGEELRQNVVDTARSALAGRHALLVFDSAEEIKDLHSVLDIRDRCGVLITSRRRQDATGTRHDISPLPLDEAISLLHAWGEDRVNDKDAAQQICERIGRLPLAIRLIGRYMAENEENVTDYLRWMTDAPLAVFGQGEQGEQSIALLLERSLAQVSNQARQVMSVVGSLALAPFTWEMVAAALDFSEVDTRRFLGELINYGLLLRPSEHYEVSYALIHTYARLQLTPTSEITMKLAAHFTDFLKQHQNEFTLLNIVRPHVLTVLQNCQAQSAWDATRDLAFAIDEYLDIQGHWTDRVAVIELGLATAKASQNRKNEGIWLSRLGSAEANLGMVQQAINHDNQALAIAQEISNRSIEGDCLNDLGSAYATLGQVQKAITYYEQALKIAQEIGDHRGEGTRLSNLGSAYRSLGQVQKAITHYEQALKIAQQIGDRRGEGIRVSNLGSAHGELGQAKQSITYYERALAIAQEIGDRSGESERLDNLGSAYSNLGKAKQAITFYEQSLAIARELVTASVKEVA